MENKKEQIENKKEQMENKTVKLNEIIKEFDLGKDGEDVSLIAASLLLDAMASVPIFVSRYTNGSWLENFLLVAASAVIVLPSSAMAIETVKELKGKITNRFIAKQNQSR